MRTILLSLLLGLGLCSGAQERCATVSYTSELTAADPVAAQNILAAESFLQKKSLPSSFQARVTSGELIKIPVVVHLLYKDASQNLSDEQVKSQIAALNRDFRRANADSTNTPARFRSLAADVNLEFYLATADPKGRATTGIVRKYTTTANWLSNDKIKFSAQGGDDAWDSKSYLNIWVGNLVSGSGYAAAPGTDGSKDGIVITTAAFGTLNRSGNTSMGRIAVHEVGHWLGLKHIWGDAQCGDDGVSDTPPQSSYTLNCPSGFRSSCNNGNLGDMYMNYMDYTADACMNLFTEGQKGRMRAAFEPGGPRESFHASEGLKAPWMEESPLTQTTTSPLFYPNPARDELYMTLGTDFIGKMLSVYNAAGGLLQSVTVKSASVRLNLSAYPAGVYFVRGEGLSQKFIRL